LKILRILGKAACAILAVLLLVFGIAWAAAMFFPAVVVGVLARYAIGEEKAKRATYLVTASPLIGGKQLTVWAQSP